MTASRIAMLAAALLFGCADSTDTPVNPPANATPAMASTAGASASPTPAAPSASPSAPTSGNGTASNAASPAGVPSQPQTPASGTPKPPAATTPAPATPGPAAPASAAPAIDPPGTVTIKTDSFKLGAGEEIYKCQNFDNPFGGKDAAVKSVVSEMSPGSHHLHLYHMTTSSSRKLEDCAIQDFHPLLYAAGSPHSEIEYPDGMAAKVLGKAGLRIQLHYINPTDGALDVSATIKLTPVDYNSVTKWVSELYFNQVGVRVPPGKGQVVTTSCAIPKTYGPIGLVSGGTHMHKRGVHFVAKTSTGAMLADVNTWDEPPGIRYDPPIMLNPGDTITWTCTYDNDTGKTLTFGESAEDNEMCIYLARFYSAPDGAQLECQASGATGTTSTRTY